VTWFAPVVSWLRDLGVYVDNELQASAVASCFTVAITNDGMPGDPLLPPSGEDTVDKDGNQYEFLQPGMIMRLQPGESVASANPRRPTATQLRGST
jgi:capsid protein